MGDLQFNLDFSGRLPASAQIGIDIADKNANERWKHIFDACVLAAAKRKPEITSDDVLAEFEKLKHQPFTVNLAAIGPAMVRAGKMKILRATNRTVRSQRPEKNGNLHRVWESLEYTPF